MSAQSDTRVQPFGTGRPRTALATRFWAKVQKANEPDGCWLWTASTRKDGYGQISDIVDGRKKNLRAHIVSYKMTNGPITHGLKVCHSCDNPLCVRPSHLFLGTNKENQEDMTRKGRGRSGEKNGRARLSEIHILEIRQAYAGGQTNKSALARRFGVSDTQIHNIVKGRQWQTQ